MSINKKELLAKCLDEVNRQIEKYQNEMDMIKRSMEANDIKTDYDEDNKGQLLSDFEKYAGYLNVAREKKETLSRIDQDHYSKTVDFGSIIETDHNYYFVAAPVGEIAMDDGSTVYTISTEAPIYEHLKGKKAEDSFNFNNKEIKIVELQ